MWETLKNLYEGRALQGNVGSPSFFIIYFS